MREMLDMGEYGWFVWPAYGVVGISLAVLFYLSMARLRAAESLLNRQRQTKK